MRRVLSRRKSEHPIAERIKKPGASCRPAFLLRNTLTALPSYFAFRLPEPITFFQLTLKIPTVCLSSQKSPSNHYANFLLACQGKEKTRSPFSIAGPLSQVFCLGVLAQRMNRKIVFDRDTKQIVNDPVMNQMLVGEMPRKGWEQYYNI